MARHGGDFIRKPGAIVVVWRSCIVEGRLLVVTIARIWLERALMWWWEGALMVWSSVVAWWQGLPMIGLLWAIMGGASKVMIRRLSTRV